MPKSSRTERIILAVCAAVAALLLLDMLATAATPPIKMDCRYSRRHTFDPNNITNPDTARLRGWMIFLACEQPPEALPYG